MARWILRTPHYLLTVNETRWEQVEVDRDTGAQARKMYTIPRYIDPKEPRDCNRDGDCIVCWEGKGQPRDIEIIGDPTPDMDPLDDEAKAESDRLRPNWKHPFDSLPAQGEIYGNQLIETWMKQMDKMAQNMGKSNQPAVDPEEFIKLQQQVKSLVETNAALMKQLEGRRI
jgi:hypothetical protein